MCDKSCKSGSSQAYGVGGAVSSYPPVSVRDRMKQLEQEVNHWAAECRAAIAQRDEAREAVSAIVRIFPLDFSINGEQVSPLNVTSAVRYAFSKTKRYWDLSSKSRENEEQLKTLTVAHQNVCQLAGEQDELLKEQARRLAELEQFAHAVKLAVGYDVGYAASLEGIVASVKNASQSTPSVKLMSLQETAADAINHMITSGDWMQYPETRQHVCNLSHDYASFNRKS